LAIASRRVDGAELVVYRVGSRPQGQAPLAVSRRVAHARHGGTNSQWLQCARRTGLEGTRRTRLTHVVAHRLRSLSGSLLPYTDWDGRKSPLPGPMSSLMLLRWP